MEGLISFHKFTTSLIHSAAQQMLASIRNALYKISPFKLKNTLAQHIPPIPQHGLIPTIKKHDHSLFGKIPDDFKFQMTQHLERLSNLKMNESLFPMKLSSFNNSFYNQPIIVRQRCFLNSSNVFQFSKKKHSPPKGNKPQQPEEDKIKLIQKNIVDLIRIMYIKGLIDYILNGKDVKKLSSQGIYKIIENIRLYETKNEHICKMANIFLFIAILSKPKIPSANFKRPKDQKNQNKNCKKSTKKQALVPFQENISSKDKQSQANFKNQMNSLQNLTDLDFKKLDSVVDRFSIHQPNQNPFPSSQIFLLLQNLNIQSPPYQQSDDVRIDQSLVLEFFQRNYFSKQFVNVLQKCLNSPYIPQSDLLISNTDELKNRIMLQRNQLKGRQLSLEDINKLLIMKSIRILASKKLKKLNKLLKLERISSVLESLNMGNYGSNPFLEGWYVVTSFIEWLNKSNKNE